MESNKKIMQQWYWAKAEMVVQTGNGIYGWKQLKWVVNLHDLAWQLLHSRWTSS